MAVAIHDTTRSAGRDDEIRLAPLEQHVVAAANNTKVWFACPSEGRDVFREMTLLA
jgi:hypothetical protein